MPRPKTEFTDQQLQDVEDLSATLTQKQLADYLGISDRHFRRLMEEDERIMSAYKKGRAKSFKAVADNLISMAKNGNVAAAIFYLKTQAGWKEQEYQETDTNVVFKIVSPDELNTDDFTTT